MRSLKNVLSFDKGIEGKVEKVLGLPARSLLALKLRRRQGGYL